MPPYIPPTPPAIVQQMDRTPALFNVGIGPKPDRASLTSAGSARRALPDNTVRLPTENDSAERVIDLIKVAFCLNLPTPYATYVDKKGNISTLALEERKKCLASAERLMRAKRAGDIVALTMALRGIPLTKARGIDGVSEESDALSTAIAQHPNVNVFEIKDNASTHIDKPFTKKEISAVAFDHKLRATPDMRPNRVLHVDMGTAYLLSYADAFIHTSSYAPTDPKTGNKILASDTAVAIRKKHSKADDDKLALLCLERDGRDINKVNFGTCGAAGVRNAFDVMATDKSIVYDPSRYTKKRSPTER